ncbi:MAG: TVP38/TMEM64 family protein [Micromonosporaceae bacterium]|nr:TVP38/TMEM64 family protein [Micromonosporaceae bacterium]
MDRERVAAAWSVRAVLAGSAVIAVSTVVTMLVVEAFGGTERWRAAVEQAGAWAPVVYVLLKATTFVAAPLSGTSLKLAAGALFGVWAGFWYTLAGNVLGGCVNFGIARWLGRPAVRRLAGARALARIDGGAVRIGGWRALLAARVFLAPFYDLVSYAAGLSNLPFRHYLAVSVVGGVPASLFFVVVGDAAARGGWVPYAVLAGCLAFGLAASAVFLLRRRRGGVGGASGVSGDPEALGPGPGGGEDPHADAGQQQAAVLGAGQPEQLPVVYPQEVGQEAQDPVPHAEHADEHPRR